MIFITTDTWQKSGVEVVIFNDIKWLNKKHIEEQLQHFNLTMITTKYPEYLQKSDKHSCRIFLREDFAIQINMDCRATPAVKFRSRLGFKKYDPIMTQEQSILTNLDSYFKTEDKLFNTVL